MRKDGFFFSRVLQPSGLDFTGKDFGGGTKDCSEGKIKLLA